jgi:hypothetical protein
MAGCLPIGSGLLMLVCSAGRAVEGVIARIFGLQDPFRGSGAFLCGLTYKKYI